MDICFTHQPGDGLIVQAQAATFIFQLVRLSPLSSFLVTWGLKSWEPAFAVPKVLRHSGQGLGGSDIVEAVAPKGHVPEGQDLHDDAIGQDQKACKEQAIP